MRGAVGLRVPVMTFAGASHAESFTTGLEGRHADYSPGLPDLPLIAHALTGIQQTKPPDIPLKLAEERWSAYTEPDGVHLLAGGTLLHTDLAPHNMLITKRAHFIDWAWPTRGAAWIDPAVLILRLMEASHTAPAADAWAQRFPSWAAAPPSAVLAFSEANARLWDEIAHNDQQPWKKDMTRHAHDWVRYWRAHALVGVRNRSTPPATAEGCCAFHSS